MTHRSTALSKADIRALFEALNAELAAESVRGEVYVVGIGIPKKLRDEVLQL